MNHLKTKRGDKKKKIVKKDNDAFDLDIINLKSKLKLAHFAYICMFIAILIWGVGLDSHSANKLGNNKQTESIIIIK